MPEKMSVVASEDPSSEATGKAEEAGMLLHKFVKATSWRGALTTDASGENLPTYGPPWIYEKEIRVRPGDRRVGASSGEILKGIAERGYFLLAVSDDA
ncbi:MAG: hypothetical protein JWO25_37 [Alphaproteobacteria bacterium]|nr:hypothetical protein [Alphaproteobacteria bacterium]